MALKISTGVRYKLTQKHSVKECEIVECFTNMTAGFLEDTREDHITNPVTSWFVAETDAGRKLKVVFILATNGDIEIKTAYMANATEIMIYDRHA